MSLSKMTGIGAFFLRHQVCVCKPGRAGGMAGIVSCQQRYGRRKTPDARTGGQNSVACQQSGQTPLHIPSRKKTFAMPTSRRTFYQELRARRCGYPLLSPEWLAAEKKKVDRCTTLLGPATICARIGRHPESPGGYGLQICGTCQLCRPEILWVSRRGIPEIAGQPRPQDAQWAYRDGQTTLG